MPRQPPSSMITAGHLLITGGEFHQHNGQDNRRGELEEAIKKLYSRAIPGALHNSGERYLTHPRCHPNTRVVIIAEILAWLDALDDDKFTMWLNGAAGAGKSAICQAVAEVLFERHQLSGSFFFSRTSGTGRNNATGLVATLAYQLLNQIPETRSVIAGIIASDHSILDLSWEVQLEFLIVKPLHEAAVSIQKALNQPKLFIIDGLDECDGEDAQSRIIRSFIEALRAIQPAIPHKLLIASRTETYLVSTFTRQDISPNIRQLRLDDSWGTHNDIRLFLTDSFTEIRKRHPLGTFLKFDWPRYSDIEHLVAKSSGQFIYAATVIRYIGADRRHPVESLKAIIGLVSDAKNQPFEELDALYRHIFSRAGDVETLLRILCLIRLIGQVAEDKHILYNREQLLYGRHYDSLSSIQSLLGLPDGMVEHHLNALASVITIYNRAANGGTWVHFLHASFMDFLTDESRSRRLFMYSIVFMEPLLKGCLLCHLHCSPADKYSDYYLLGLCLHLVPVISQKIGKNEEDDINFHSAFLELDLDSLIDTILPAAETGWLAEAFGKFVGCLIEKHTQMSLLGRSDLLSQPLQQMAGWFINKFQKFPFNGFDNAQGIDISLHVHRWYTTNNPDEWLYMMGYQGPKVSSPSSLTKFWNLLNLMPISFLADAVFFGQYAFTEQRSMDVATGHLRRLLPKLENADRPSLSKPSDNGYQYLIGVMIYLLKDLAPNEELYLTCRRLCGQGVEIRPSPPNSTSHQTHLAGDWSHSYARTCSSVDVQLRSTIDVRGNPLWLKSRTKVLSKMIVDYMLFTCKDFRIAWEFKQSQVYNRPDRHLWAWNSMGMRWASWYHINVFQWMDTT